MTSWSTGPREPTPAVHRLRVRATHPLQGPGLLPELRRTAHDGVRRPPRRRVLPRVPVPEWIPSLPQRLRGAPAPARPPDQGAEGVAPTLRSARSSS